MGVLRSKFFQAVFVLAVSFLFFRYGIKPPAPWSVFSLYMTVVLIAVLVYVSSDSDSWRGFVAPIRSALVDDSKRPIRFVLMVLLPILIGYYAYTQAAATIEAPPELRAVHPAPPASVTFRGKPLDIQGLENPLRKDTANFKKYVAEGAEIYVKNCMYCHGDNLDGNGHFARAFNPPPASFQDPGTIAMLQEAFLFWRIAKGGPGLPRESTPWNSVMPAWEDRLSEEEIWKVIFFLYDFTGYQPRRWEAHASLSGGVSPSRSPSWTSPTWVRHDAASLRFTPHASRFTPWLVSAAEAQQAGDANAGRAVYEKRCAWCHGAEGKGDGPGAGNLDPRPRDFTKGLYKIRTTASGRPPTDADLFRIISEGMPGTSMPAWKSLGEKDRWNLVAYLKTFAPDSFKETPKALDLPKEVNSSKESLARGKEMFEAIECNKCHGAAGRGDGPSAPELKDDWGNPVQPANLTKPWTFRGGAGRKEIAARLATGLMGTPMPTFIDSVEKPEDIWHLANYVQSLSPGSPNYATVLKGQPTSAEISDDPAEAFWNQFPPSNFPMAGQVIVDPRNFSPSIDMVSVRVVYNASELAFHLTWDDPTQSTPDPAKKSFPDSVAIQLPAKMPSGNERPYVFMGDGGTPVYLLLWRSDTGVSEATATGRGQMKPLPGEPQAKGKAVVSNGQYRLVIKRALTSQDPNRLPFPVGTFLPVAFMAWDGGRGETGTKMSMTSWYYFRLEEPASQTKFVIPPFVALAVAAAELLIVRRARTRRKGETT